MTKAVNNDLGYNEVPYGSYPFHYNRPEWLRTIGELFDMQTVPLEKARILELGCSDGNNLFRFAESYPESYTLGVDLSDVEIEHGLEHLKKTGLKNVELKAMSLTDLDESYGKFDYIICHGILSWVPDFAKKGIFEVSKKLLSENGIAFISYNTLPGWNMVNTVRELMMYHSSGFSKVTDKIFQARAALDFLKESLHGQNTPHAQFMENSAKNMSSREDQYLRHEYLADENKAFYFHEFMEMATDNDFAYLGDTDLQRMYIGNLPQKTVEMLNTLNDIVKVEQYADFIRNTQFRCSLLCHEGTKLSRNVTYDIINKFSYYAQMHLSVPDDQVNLTDSSRITFQLDEPEKTVSSSSPAMKAMLMSLYKNTAKPLSLSELMSAAKKLVPALTKDEMLVEINANFAKLMFLGYIHFVFDQPHNVNIVSDKPEISKLNLMQVKRLNANNKIWITSAINKLILVELHQAGIVSLLDGKHTIEQINKQTLEDLKTGKISAADGGEKITDEERLKSIASALVEDTLMSLKENFCLIA